MDKALLCTQCDRFSCICERTKTTSSLFKSTENSDCNTANKAVATEEDSTDNPSDLLRRSSSQSNSSLNFGSNIFKRFAERMSSNSNLFSTSFRNSTTNNELQTEKT